MLVVWGSHPKMCLWARGLRSPGRNNHKTTRQGNDYKTTGQG